MNSNQIIIEPLKLFELGFPLLKVVKKLFSIQIFTTMNTIHTLLKILLPLLNKVNTLHKHVPLFKYDLPRKFIVASIKEN